MLIEQNSRHTGLSVMRLCMAVAMWQAINWQRQTRERAGRVQGEGRWKWCWVGRIARPNPFLSPQPSPTAVLPRTLYFDRRASLGRHESFGTTPSLEACNVLRKLIRTMHCISITRTSLSIAIAFHCNRFPLHPLHNHYQTNTAAISDQSFGFHPTPTVPKYYQS
jgi:hypothetical protein